jgi:hypothetical protein
MLPVAALHVLAAQPAVRPVTSAARARWGLWMVMVLGVLQSAVQGARDRSAPYTAFEWGLFAQIGLAVVGLCALVRWGWLCARRRWKCTPIVGRVAGSTPAEDTARRRARGRDLHSITQR